MNIAPAFLLNKEFVYWAKTEKQNNLNGGRQNNLKSGKQVQGGIWELHYSKLQRQQEFPEVP